MRPQHQVVKCHRQRSADHKPATFHHINVTRRRTPAPYTKRQILSIDLTSRSQIKCFLQKRHSCTSNNCWQWTWRGISIGAPTLWQQSTRGTSIICWPPTWLGITIGESNTLSVNHTCSASIVIWPVLLVGTWFRNTVGESNTFTINYNCRASIVVWHHRQVGTWFGIKSRSVDDLHSERHLKGFNRCLTPPLGGNLA